MAGENQTITFNYQQEGTAEGFNKLLHNVIPTGIISGGELSKINNTNISVSALEMIICGGDVTVHVSTDSPTTDITVTQTTPFIVARYNFTQTQNNWVSFISVNSSSILPNDVVLGKCNYNGSTMLDVFDYSIKGWHPFHFNYNKDGDYHYGYYDSYYKQCLPNFWITKPNVDYGFNFRIGGGDAIIDGIQVHVNPHEETLVTNDPTSDLYISVPTTFPRTDILILKSDGSLEYKMGTEGSSTPPIFPSYGLVIAEFAYTDSTDLSQNGFYGNVIKNIYTNNYISNGSYVGTGQTDEHTLYL